MVTKGFKKNQINNNRTLFQRQTNTVSPFNSAAIEQSCNTTTHQLAFQVFSCTVKLEEGFKIAYS